MELEFSGQIFEVYWNVKFHEDPLSESRTFHLDGRTDMSKLMVAFRSFGAAPKMVWKNS